MHLQDWFGPLSDPAIEFPSLALVGLLTLLGIVHVAKAIVVFATPLLQWLADDVYEFFQLFGNMLVAANPWRRRHPPPRVPEAVPQSPPSTPPQLPPSPDLPTASHLGHAKRSTLRELRAYRSSFARRPRLRHPKPRRAEIHP